MVSSPNTPARALPLALFATLAGVAGGCTGALDLDTGDDDDDDATPAGPDRSYYDGVEYVDIDWSEAAEATGSFDCQAQWAAEAGPGDPADCPACDHVWAVSLSALLGAEDCFDNTGFPFVAERTVRFGVALDPDGLRFRAWRAEGDDPLVEVGRGAVDDDGFTWSGRDGYTQEGASFSWWSSGEGAF